MAWFVGTMISRDFEGQIADLEAEISNRELKAPEAKIFYDHLTLVHRKVCAFETDVKTLQYGPGNTNNQLPNCLNAIRKIHLRALNLKIKLTEIMPAIESTSSNETNEDKQPEAEATKKSEKPKSKTQFVSTSWTESFESFASSLSESSSESEESSSESDSEIIEPKTSSTKTNSTELKSVCTLKSIEVKLSNLESLCEDILELRSDHDDNWTDTSSSSDDSIDDTYEQYENIIKKITYLETTQSNNFLYQGMILFIFFILLVSIVFVP
ncbi:uncharacterized protein LOC135844597 [Planococcus citri]|uniref:uncharacterized protein LOC135844597 n=1 Tax=Planococcus citri TaxID=170843 RepID=UPI0031F7D2A6